MFRAPLFKYLFIWGDRFVFTSDTPNQTCLANQSNQQLLVLYNYYILVQCLITSAKKGPPQQLSESVLDDGTDERGGASDLSVRHWRIPLRIWYGCDETLGRIWAKLQCPLLLYPSPSSQVWSPVRCCWSRTTPGSTLTPSGRSWSCRPRWVKNSIRQTNKVQVSSFIGGELSTNYANFTRTYYYSSTVGRYMKRI